MREAMRFAEAAHRGQFRKGTDDSPYILHPISVAMTLARAGAEEDLLVIGLLHDVAEDTALDLSEIENRFGVRVVAILTQLTKASNEDPSAAEVAEMLQSPEAVQVKSADLIVNLSDVIFDVSEHGVGHLETLFNDPAAKTHSYLSLARLLIERLAPQSPLRVSLIELSSRGRDLRKAIEV